MSWSLEKGRKNLSTDSRDLIFGLLGIADPSHQLQVDYRSSVEEVYTTTFRNMLRSEGSPNVLRSITGEDVREEFDRSPVNHGKLPSWVPDLYLHRIASTASVIQTERKLPTLAKNRNAYAASGNYELESKIEFEFEDDGRTLVLIGLVADTISETGGPGPTEGDSILGKSSIIDLLPGWKSLARPHESSPGRKRDDMFWRTILLDMKFEGIHSASDQTSSTRHP